MRLVPQPEPTSPTGAPSTRPGHAPTLTRSRVIPRGWAEAWVWTCSCGLPSWSILRDRADAYRDHDTQHLRFEVDQRMGRLREDHP